MTFQLISEIKLFHVAIQGLGELPAFLEWSESPKFSAV